MITNPRPMPSLLRRQLTLAFSFLSLTAFLLSSLPGANAADPAPTPPLKDLFLTGGGYHDYAKLAPFLTTEISHRVNASFDVDFTMDRLTDPKFADAYDAILYDLCFDEVTDAMLDNALAATRNGKPTVMLHCSVHAFRKSQKVHEWETCCGMRSKVHDRFEPFTVIKLDPESPITKAFPSEWSTPGDELYQTISIEPESHQLLQAKSPQDGREHIVCWTYQFGKGHVFSTTLGHDMKTASSPEYLALISNGLLWTCDKLTADAKPAPGYAGTQAKP